MVNPVKLGRMARADVAPDSNVTRFVPGIVGCVPALLWPGAGVVLDRTQRANVVTVSRNASPPEVGEGKRGALTKWWVSLTIAALVIMLTTLNKLDLVSPGPLSSYHGAIESCSNCHDSVEGGIRMWLSAFNRSDLHQKNDENCQVCHDLGSSPLTAHSIADDDWNKKVFSQLETDPIGEDKNVKGMHHEASSKGGISVRFATQLLSGQVNEGKVCTATVVTRSTMEFKAVLSTLKNNSAIFVIKLNSGNLTLIIPSLTTTHPHVGLALFLIM